MPVARQRPHFEAAAALGAAGFAIPAQPFKRRPVMPDTVRFALFRDPLNPTLKPAAYSTLRDLAKAIHRHRGDGGLEYEERDIEVRRDGGNETALGVSLWTQDATTGQRAAFIGWAYLDGLGQQALTNALASLAPIGPVIAGRAA